MAHKWNLASIANIANKLSHDSHLYISYNPVFPELNSTNHSLKPGPQGLCPRFSITPAARSVAVPPPNVGTARKAFVAVLERLKEETMQAEGYR